MKAETRRRKMDREVVERLLMGKSQNKIVAELRISKNRVREIIARAIEAGYLNSDLKKGNADLPVPPARLWENPVDQRKTPKKESDSIFEEHFESIKSDIENGITPITIFEELNLNVSRPTFYRYLNAKKLVAKEIQKKIVVPIQSGPGEVLRLDWGLLTSIEVSGRKIKIWVLAGVLGHSRMRFGRIMIQCNFQNTVKAIASILSEIGGVPKILTVDNAKVFVSKADFYEACINVAAARFASHYGFVFEALPPRRPELKGKVERQIPYIRRLCEGFLKNTRNDFDLDELQQHLNLKLEDANQKKHRTTKLIPKEELHKEKEFFLPLPTKEYPVELVKEVTVRKDSFAQVNNKFYSLDSTYQGKRVLAISNLKKVEFYFEGKCIESHEKIVEKDVFYSVKEKHQKGFQNSIEQLETYILKARSIGPETEKVIQRLIDSREYFLALRPVWGVLNLGKDFSPNEVEKACFKANLSRDPGYQTIKKFIIEHRILLNGVKDVRSN